MPTKFFRVDGADQETGEETYLVLRAKTRPQAEKLARDQGMLIASVRIANPEDWGATGEESGESSESPAATHTAATEEEPQMHATSHADSVSPAEEHHEPAPEHFVDAAPAVEPPHQYAAESTRALARRSSAPVAAPSSAGAVVLVCAGAALIIGGVLALVLALWPDNTTLRNELQQIDFRLHSLVQTLLGSMLVLSGLIVCLIAAICYLLPRRAD